MRNDWLVFAVPFGVVPLCAALTACTISRPVTIVGSHAMVLHGTLTATIPNEISLQATDGKLACSGTHQGVFGQSVVINVTCNDGRKGVAVIEGEKDHTKGRLHLEDGTDGEIVVGAS